MSNGDSITLPLTTPQIVARLSGIPRADAETALGQVAAQDRTPGLQVIAAINLAQVQSAVGYRRPINYFAY